MGGGEVRDDPNYWPREERERLLEQMRREHIAFMKDRDEEYTRYQNDWWIKLLTFCGRGLRKEIDWAAEQGRVREIKSLEFDLYR